MRLRYETGIATLIQFIALAFLNIATAIDSSVTTCHTSSSDCVSNMLVSIIYFLLLTAWFGIVWMLGFMAQERRSKRLAQLLICAEGLIALIALFNARHHTDILGFATSLIDLALAVWIIWLAFRLMRSSGGRIVARQRPHARRRRPTADL